MNFDHDDAALSVSVALDDADAPGLDLTGGTGRQLLQLAVDGMSLAFGNEESPAGDAWDELRPATVSAKGHSAIGIRSGRMLADLHAGAFSTDRRSATWSYPTGETFARASAFHNGRPGVQPARPFIGWTDDAQAQARALIAAAQADPQPEE